MGFSSNKDVKEGYALEKKRYFAAIGSPSVKTVADWYRQVTGHVLFSFINIDDIK